VAERLIEEGLRIEAYPDDIDERIRMNDQAAARLRHALAVPSAA
jgi:hypothetical protein